jgi:hypothetical protein
MPAHVPTGGKVLAAIASADFDRSAEIDRFYARNTEALCTAELGAR